MKNILVFLHNDREQEARLQVAIDLTRQLSGHLICLDIVIPPEWGDESITRWGLSTLLQLAREGEASNKSAIEKRMASEGVSWEMLGVTGDPGDEIPRAIGFADLVILTSQAPSHDLDHALRIAGEVIVKAKRPVLVVPPKCRGFDPCGKVLVAWDGEAEANEAMRAAVPLLEKAYGVTVLQFNGPGGPLELDDAVGYLRRYGINSGPLSRETDDRIADAILERAQEEGARYVVMGAYGSGRIPEAIFGGVTKRLLRESNVPLLVFH
ncbi:universal stress protein [Qipengyuania zhejiangensis]|uniref:universal stress protein n=1 Tax=Qipengyuania zhejiangensis TaxID=3077782 RepID=UPI002D77BBFF|nr:universal stress protein [Qipengyuania sp. Z2]